MAVSSECVVVPACNQPPLFDLERPIYEIGSLQRIAEIVLERILDCGRPDLPKVDGYTALLVNNDDVAALQQAVFLASDASGRLKREWLAAVEKQRFFDRQTRNLNSER